MAITNARMSEGAYKKIKHGVSISGDGTRVYYLEPTSDLNVLAENVWLDAGKVPSTKPTIGSNGSSLTSGDVFDKNGYHSNHGSYDGHPVVQYFADIAMALMPGTTASYQISGGETKILDYKFLGGIYAPLVKNQSNAVVSFGQNSGELDVDAGLITFFDGNVPGVTSLKLTYWKYVGNTLASSISSGYALSSKKYKLASDNLVSGVTLIDYDSDTFNDTFVIQHNLNSAIAITQILKGNEVYQAHSIRYINSNQIQVEMRPTLPVNSDNVYIDVIKIN